MFSRRSLLWGALVALISVVLVTSVRLLIEAHAPTGHAPFVMFALAVVIAGIFGGFMTALIATLLAILAIDFLFLEPLYSLEFYDRTYIFQHVLFVTQGVVIAILSELYHRNYRAARMVQAELESRVEQRTQQLATVNQQLMAEVHERSQAEQSLSVERNSLSALLESLQDGIIACDADGKIIRHNAAAVRMCGIDNPSESPDSWWSHMQLFDSDTGRRLEGEDWPLARVLREGRYDEEEVRLVTADGTERLVSVSGRIIRNPEGRVIGGVISLHDVTDIVDARQRLTDVVEELRRSNRELQDFASVASHDLQEPLRKIQAFGDRLKVTQGERLNDQGRDYLDRMHNAAGRMQVLINDLLAFSRVTTKAQPFEQIDMAEIVTDVISDLEERITSSDGRVEVGDLPPLQADPIQMRQLVQNLLSNALKFRKPDVPPVVRISARAYDDENDEQWVELRVADNGIGFDRKYLQRIFGIFQRLHGRMEYEGTGVGLAVCRKIVERHGGEITAESQFGEGATFIVTLPRYQQEAERTHATA